MTRREAAYTPGGSSSLDSSRVIGLEVDVLRRYVHQGEVEGALVGQDVSLGDLVGARLHIAHEGPAGLAPGALVGLLEEALEVLQGKLGVHGHQAIPDAHDGVHPVARRELVLERIVLLGEHLGEHVLEERLAEPAPDLGRLEDLLEAGNAPPHVEDALVCLAHLAQAALDVPHHASHVLELLLTLAPTCPICAVIWAENWASSWRTVAAVSASPFCPSLRAASTSR
jgi:hypothetical protein